MRYSSAGFKLGPYRTPGFKLISLSLTTLFVAFPLAVIWSSFAVSKLTQFDTRTCFFITVPPLFLGAIYLIWSEWQVRPAGELSVGSGRMYFNAWTGKPRDISLRDIQKKAIVVSRPPDPWTTFLCLWLPGFGNRILIHHSRLESGVSLLNINEAIENEIQSMGRTREVSKKSERWVTWTNLVLKIHNSRIAHGWHWVHLVVLLASILIYLLTKK